ncbi:MAG: hypothetical protein ACRDZW_11880 [Acidimicrobiales bacterium]
MALAIVGAACSGGGGDASGGGTTTPPPSGSRAPSTTSTPTTRASEAESFAIPEVIDEAYVNRILAKLYSIDGDVVRKLVARTITPADFKLERAIFNDPQYDVELEVLRRDLNRSAEGLKQPPGNRKVRVRRLIAVDKQCVVAEVTVDFADVVDNPPADNPNKVNFIALQPTQPDADNENINPTPYSISDAEMLDLGKLPDRPCE